MDVNKAYCDGHFTIYTYNKSLCCSKTNISYVNFISIKKSVMTYSWQLVHDWCNFCTEVFYSPSLSVNLEGKSFESAVLLDTNFSHFLKLCVHLLPPGLSPPGQQVLCLLLPQQLAPSALAEVCAPCVLPGFKQHGLDEATGDVYIACTK